MLRKSFISVAMIFTSPALAGPVPTPTSTTASQAAEPTKGYDPSAGDVPGYGKLQYGGAAPGYGSETEGYSGGSSASEGPASVRSRLYIGSVNRSTGHVITTPDDQDDTVAAKSMMNAYSGDQREQPVNGGATYDPH